MGHFKDLKKKIQSYIGANIDIPEYIENAIIDLTYPFRQYSEVQDFISRNAGAYAFLSLSGFLIRYMGFATAVAAAVGTQALASVFTELILRAITDKEKPYKGADWIIRSAGLLVTVILSLGMFIHLQGYPFGSLMLIGMQFAAGLGITYIGGVTYQRFHRNLEKEDRTQLTKILIPGLATLGVVAILLASLSGIASVVGAESMVDVLKTPLENQTANMTAGK